MLTFNDLKLVAPILQNLIEQDYHTPTPVQAQAIPFLLEGRDLLGCARTGTGKTAAFALPILQKLFTQERPAHSRRIIKALILSPTRELASQIGDSFRTYGRAMGLTQATIFGGVSYRTQIQSVARGVDILVATPGRLLDLVKQGIISLKQVEIFVIDEADQMFDMGFFKELQKIIAELPAKRQNILFSATMPQAIAKLADAILVNPEKLTLSTVSSTAENVTQQVLFIDRKNKSTALNTIFQGVDFKRGIVFSATKHGADRIVEHLDKMQISSDAIHGDKKQSVRRRILDSFKRGSFDVLVATDVAARGIDVDGVTHVINYDLPNIAENYVHRIGRTGRAGASGTAITFCASEEKSQLRSIETLIKMRLTILDNKELGLPESSNSAPSAPSGRKPAPRGRFPSKSAGAGSFGKKKEWTPRRDEGSRSEGSSERRAYGNSRPAEGRSEGGGQRSESNFKREGGFRSDAGFKRAPRRDEGPRSEGSSERRPYSRPTEGRSEGGQRSESSFKREGGFRSDAGFKSSEGFKRAPRRDEGPRSEGSSERRPYSRPTEGRSEGGQRSESNFKREGSRSEASRSEGFKSEGFRKPKEGAFSGKPANSSTKRPFNNDKPAGQRFKKKA